MFGRCYLSMRALSTMRGNLDVSGPAVPSSEVLTRRRLIDVVPAHHRLLLQSSCRFRLRLTIAQLTEATPSLPRKAFRIAEPVIFRPFQRVEALGAQEVVLGVPHTVNRLALDAWPCETCRTHSSRQPRARAAARGLRAVLASNPTRDRRAGGASTTCSGPGGTSPQGPPSSYVIEYPAIPP
jgi:hypothetical protein